MQSKNLIAALLSNRRSCRAFLPETLHRAELEEILRPALRSPSNCNTQPWFLHIASGEVIERLRTRLTADFSVGRLSLDFPYDGKYQGVYRDRQYAAAQALYSAMDITRDDKAGRHEAFMRNFSFFDAPHVGFFFLPEGFGLREACDLGMFAQSVMLLLESAGLQSCPQTALGFLADSVRDELQIGPEQRLMFGLSFGYPDPEATANRCITERAPLADVLYFHG